MILDRSLVSLDVSPRTHSGASTPRVFRASYYRGPIVLLLERITYSTQLTTESRRGRRKLGRTRVRHTCLSFNERFGNNDSYFLQRASLPRREAVAATWTERNYLHRSFLLWQEPECSLRELSLIHRGKTNEAEGCSLTGEEMYLEKLKHSCYSVKVATGLSVS